MKRHILLVDEDKLVLKALNRSLRTIKDQWDISHSQTPRQALKLLDRTAIDVLITEVRLTNADSERFLREFLRKQPHAARIVLTGYTNPNAIFKYAGLAHQLLAKPWDNQTLIETILRANLISDLLADPHLKRTLNLIENFPVIPSVFIELTEKLKSSETSLQDVGEIIIRDPALTIKLLQIVNSPYYGLPVAVAEPRKAVSLLGLDIIKGFVLTSGLFQRYEKHRLKNLAVDELWRHSMETANIVRHIAKQEQLQKDVAETSYIASLLHDIGKIIIAEHFPDEFNEVCLNSRADNIPLWKAEQSVLGATHAEIGAYLLGLWGLPMTVINAVLEHHQPRMQEHSEIDQTALLHVANAFERERRHRQGEETGPMDINADYIRHLDIHQNVETWLQQISRIA